MLLDLCTVQPDAAGYVGTPNVDLKHWVLTGKSADLAIL